MRAHHRMVDRRRLAPLRFGHQVGAVAARAREVEVVHGAQAGDALLPLRRQTLVGAVHVAEVRLAADSGHHFAVDDRRLARHAPPGTIGMPGERALVGMASVRIAVLVEIRQPVQLGKAVGVIHGHHVHLNFAELPRERDLRRRRQLLRREDQHLVAQEGVVEGAKDVRRHARREIQPADARTELRRQRLDRERRGRAFESAHRIVLRGRCSPCRSAT